MNRTLRRMGWMGGGLAVTLGTGVALTALAGWSDTRAHADAPSAGKTRVYHLAADEVDCNYAPTGINKVTGDAFGDAQNVFVQQGQDRIGSVYRKSQHREYSDATFTKRKPVPAKWQHLGILRPPIQAEVGDTITVLFENNTRFPASVDPHGVRYAKDSEGAPYDDGTSGAKKKDDLVRFGETHTCTWQVPERAGPGPMDGSSVMWMYHSHVDEPGDTNAGLMGPRIR